MEAAKFVYIAHQRQVDKNKVPYIFHLMEVAEKQTTERATILALLHDYAEDTGDMSYDKLVTHMRVVLGVPKDIVDGMWLLKHQKNEPYMDYIARIVQSNDMDVIHVKKADLLSNSNPQRMESLEKETQERLQRKYSEALAYLSEFAD